MAAQGTILGGRYRLFDVLGDGGMARVFRAEDERLHRVVAVKVLHQQYTAQPEFVRRFEREAQLAASLAHPNIVAIYDVGRDDETYFIVMEYVEGSSLKALITREGRLRLNRIIPLMRQLGQALDFAHTHGVIHRDVKPENILLTPSDLAKVGDFGIARALTSPGQTATGMVLGSVSYFSPEQAQGKPATAESDIYSSGIVLYEMLTGRLPFAADNPLATAMQHITQQPAPPNTLVHTLPSGVDDVVLKALNKNPAARFHSGVVLADALAATAMASPIGAAPGAVRGRAAPASRSLPTMHSARTLRMPRPVAGTPARRRAPVLSLLVLLLVGGGAVFAATHGLGLGNILGLAGGTSGTPTPSATPSVRARATRTTPGGGVAAFTHTPTATVAIHTPTAAAPTYTPTGAATATPSSSPTVAHRATASATSTPHPSATPTPTDTAISKGSKGITAEVVTAGGCGDCYGGAAVAVDVRNTFNATAGNAYIFVHIFNLPPGARIGIHWTLPNGKTFNWICTACPDPTFVRDYPYYEYRQLVGPGSYTVSALVNGKVVGTSHRFTVKATGGAPHKGTPATGATSVPANAQSAQRQALTLQLQSM